MKKIGFFDSGAGGLTVLYRALAEYPEEEYLYFADTAHVPYGQKTEEEIRALTTENVRFLVEQGADAVVVACNTATAAAIRFLRETFSLPMIGMEPAVKPAVSFARDKGEGKRVIVAATPLTLKEPKLQDLLSRVDDTHLVDLVALPELVLFAEREEFETKAVRAYLTEQLAPFAGGPYAALVLGCTHFLYFRKLIAEQMGADVTLFDGNAGTVRRLADVLSLKKKVKNDAEKQKLLTERVTFFASGKDVTKTPEAARYLRLLEFVESNTPVL